MRQPPACCAAERTKLVGVPIGEFAQTPLNLGDSSETLVQGGTIRDRAMIWRRHSGGRVELSVSASMLRDDRGVPGGVVYVAFEINEHLRAQQIEYQAFHDPLTGLPNRLRFREHLDAAVERVTQDERALAVFFLDLDGFKRINDSLGHSAGDQMLQTVAQRLRRTLRREDAICRFGGDEFLVVSDLARDADAEVVGAKILRALSEPFRVGGDELFVTASIGGALYPDHGSDAETLLKNADAAMYQAKAAGKNTFRLFGAAASAKVRLHLSIETRLRHALENDELRLHFQPILDLQDETVVGAEALLRWESDDRLLPPEEFLHVAEEAQLMPALGAWVLDRACREAATWLPTADSQLLRVAINLSPRQLHDPGLVDRVVQTLRSTGLPAAALELEITESAAMETAERTILVMARLEELGVSIAIDDFGTGYSSLAYLQRLPIDALKIDQSFVRGLGRGGNEEAIIQATLGMARALGLMVTAEGVETEPQRRFLQAHRCDRAQGFLFARPLPQADVRSWMAAAPQQPPAADAFAAENPSRRSGQKLRVDSARWLRRDRSSAAPCGCRQRWRCVAAASCCAPSRRPCAWSLPDARSTTPSAAACAPSSATVWQSIGCGSSAGRWDSSACPIGRSPSAT